MFGGHMPDLFFILFMVVFVIVSVVVALFNIWKP